MDAARLGMADFGSGPQRAARRGRVERLADLPRSLEVARGDLKVAAREVDAGTVAIDEVEREFGFEVAAPAFERKHQLDLEMHVLCSRRGGCRCFITDDSVVGSCGRERR